MKRESEKNYRIKVTDISLEENKDNRKFFKGVYSITINECIDFIVLPKEFFPKNKFISIPSNPDRINSYEEAIGSLSLSFEYFICSNYANENNIEIIYSSDETTRKKRNYFFLASEELFLKIQKEIHELYIRTPFTTNFLSRDEIKEYKVINFLETQVFCSFVLKDKDYESLERYGECIIRKFIDRVILLNEKNLNIYHGYLDQLERIEFIEKGILEYEYHLIGSRHRFLKNKKTILFSNPTHRYFWTILKSEPTEIFGVNRYYISGISLFLKKEEPNIYCVEGFRKIFVFDSENDFSICEKDNLNLEMNLIQIMAQCDIKEVTNEIMDKWISFIIAERNSF